uniref:Uncharacterized protein n=1 Tax=Anguilla anguilla TaxID=7936 RepID=A0A0E9U6C4_ANGAN
MISHVFISLVFHSLINVWEPTCIRCHCFKAMTPSRLVAR